MTTNEQSIRELITEALNTVYDKLKTMGDDPDMVDLVTDAAYEWINECYVQEHLDNPWG